MSEDPIKIEDAVMPNAVPMPPPPIHQNNDPADIDTVSEMPLAPEARADMRSSHNLIGVAIGIVVLLIVIITIAVIGFFIFRGGVMDRANNVTNDQYVDDNDNDDVQNDLAKKSVVCQEVVRNGVMGDPVAEMDLEDMQEEFNDILANEGSDISLTLEEACMFSVIVNDTADVIAEESVVDTEAMMTKAATYETKYNMSQNTLKKISTASEAILRYMRKEASNASVKSAISSTVPGMILCMDENGFLMEPVEGQEICRGKKEYGLWPTISDRGAQWGGCKMHVERASGIVEHFSYCAVLANGTIMMCTDMGCDLDGDIIQKNGSEH